MTRTLDGNPLASPLTGGEELAGIQDNADVTIPLSALIALLSGSVADATATVKGKVKLAGDLAGTADFPTVPGLTGKADAAGTTAALNLRAPIASPTFTGTVTLPGNAGANLVAVPKQQLDTGLALKANDNAVVKLTGPSDVTGIIKWRGASDASPVVVRPPSGDDGRAGVFDLNSQTPGAGFIFHMTGGVTGGGFAGGQLIGLGAGGDAGETGLGLTVNVRGRGRGIALSTYPSCSTYGDASNSYPFLGQQNSTNSTFMRLDQQVAGAKAILELVSNANQAGQQLMRWAGAGWGGSNEGGYLSAFDGSLNILRGGLKAWNGVVVQATDALDTATAGTYGVSRMLMAAGTAAWRGYQWSGAANLFYASQVRTDVNGMVLQQSQGAAAMGSEVWDTIIGIGQGNLLGLHGVTPVARQSLAADATDLATVIALANDIKAKLVTKGLCS